MDQFSGSDEIAASELENANKILGAALLTERRRKWRSKEPAISEDADVAGIQKQLDMPKTLAEAAVKERRRRKLMESPPERGK